MRLSEDECDKIRYDIKVYSRRTFYIKSRQNGSVSEMTAFLVDTRRNYMSGKPTPSYEIVYF